MTALRQHVVRIVLEGRKVHVGTKRDLTRVACERTRTRRGPRRAAFERKRAHEANDLPIAHLRETTGLENNADANERKLTCASVDQTHTTLEPASARMSLLSSGLEWDRRGQDTHHLEDLKPEVFQLVALSDALHVRRQIVVVMRRLVQLRDLVALACVARQTLPRRELESKASSAESQL